MRNTIAKFLISYSSVYVVIMFIRIVNQEYMSDGIIKFAMLHHFLFALGVALYKK